MYQNFLLNLGKPSKHRSYYNISTTELGLIAEFLLRNVRLLQLVSFSYRLRECLIGYTHLPDLSHMSVIFKQENLPTQAEDFCHNI